MEGGWGKGVGKATPPGQTWGEQSWGGDAAWKGGGKGDSWGKGGGKGDQWGAGKGDPWGAGNAWGGKGWTSKGKGYDEWGGKGSWGGDSWKGGGKGKGDSWGGKDAWGGKGEGKKGEGKTSGKIQQRIWAGEEPHVGTIKSYNAEKMAAFIVDEQVWNMVGTDVYCFKKVLERCGAGVGDTVCFFLHWSPRGQAQASAPIVRLSGGERTYALKGVFKPNDAGFGFIQCSITKELFGRDVFVPKTMLDENPLAMGQTVKFNASLTPDWKPNALSFELCDETWEPLAADLSVSHEDPKHGTYSAGGITGFGEEGVKRRRPAEPTGEIMTGTLKTFSENNNWGFIDCEEARAKWGKDVWVVGHSLLEPNMKTPGAVQLQFEIALNEKGQPQAANIVGMKADGTFPPRPESSLMASPAAKVQKLEEIDPVAAALGLDMASSGTA